MKAWDVKLRLKDVRPITWRDVLIPENITFKKLDKIINILFDFSGCHLSAFTFKDNPSVIMDLSKDILTMGDEIDSNTTYIDEYFKNNKKIYYEYDFGDGWEIDIEIKKLVDYDKTYPTLKRFKGGYNPVEDCGGPWAFEEMIKNGEITESFDKDFVQMMLEDLK